MYDVVLAAKRRSVAGELPKAKLTEIIQSVGFNPNCDGVLADRRLRDHASLLDVVCWDWVHTALQDGFLTGEASLLIQAQGIPRSTLQEWLKWDGWRFPKHRQTKAEELHRIFSHYRESAADPVKIKASCSELLGLYGLLRHFVEINVPAGGGSVLARDAFFAACGVVDLLLEAKRVNTAPGDAATRLETATVRYLDLHIQAHGTGWVRPKHHWMLDIPAQVRRSGCIIDAFVIERHHLIVKAVAEQVKRTTAFERSVLSGVLNVMCNSSDEESHADGLRGRQAKLPSSHNVVVADALRSFGVDIAVGDVVRCGNLLGIARACVREADTLAVAVTVLDVIARPTAHHARCKLVEGRGLEVWSPADVCQCNAWYPEDAILVVLL